MKSPVIKEIRSLDKDLRESVKGFPLFKINFKHLRDLEDQRVAEILDWYKSLFELECYRSLVKLYRENSTEYWLNIQKRASYLPEYGKLQYRLQIFVAEVRSTMPNEIKPEKKK